MNSKESDLISKRSKSLICHQIKFRCCMFNFWCFVGINRKLDPILKPVPKCRSAPSSETSEWHIPCVQQRDERSKENEEVWSRTMDGKWLPLHESKLGVPITESKVEALKESDHVVIILTEERLQDKRCQPHFDIRDGVSVVQRWNSLWKGHTDSLLRWGLAPWST